MIIHTITPRAMDGNIFLIEDEQFVLVDSGTGESSQSQVDQIQQVMARSGRPEEEQKLSALILTHYHHDHSGGASRIKEAFDCGVYIHEAELQPLRDGDPVATGAAMFFATQQPVEAKALDMTQPFSTGSARFRLMETPGHSPGSICLYHEDSRTLVSGDTVFPGGGIGRWDLEGGNHRQLVKSIGLLKELDVADIYAGHGPVVKGSGNRNIKASFMNVSLF